MVAVVVTMVRIVRMVVTVTAVITSAITAMVAITVGANVSVAAVITAMVSIAVGTNVTVAAVTAVVSIAVGANVTVAAVTAMVAIAVGANVTVAAVTAVVAIAIGANVTAAAVAVSTRTSAFITIVSHGSTSGIGLRRALVGTRTCGARVAVVSAASHGTAGTCATVTGGRRLFGTNGRSRVAVVRCAVHLGRCRTATIFGMTAAAYRWSLCVV